MFFFPCWAFLQFDSLVLKNPKEQNGCAVDLLAFEVIVIHRVKSNQISFYIPSIVLYKKK